jgi:tetratricopeptide (TPR) repeat protein
MQALTGLGRVHYVQGSLDQARAHLAQALDIARELGHRAGEVGILTNLGHLHFARGEHGPAERYFAEVLTTAGAGGDQLGTLNALNCLGWVAASSGRFETTDQHHSRALALARTIGHRLGELIALAGLGDVHLAGSRYPLAAECFAQVLDLAERTGIRNYASEAHLGLGRAHRGGADTRTAQADYQQALAISVDLDQPHDQVRSHDGLAHVARDLGDTAAARRHWTTAVDLLASLDTPAADDVTAVDMRAHLAALDDPSGAPTPGDPHRKDEPLPTVHGPAPAAQPDRGRSTVDRRPTDDATTPRNSPRARAVTCSRHGHSWRLDDGEQAVLVPHSVGMLHLAVLLANPDKDIPSIDLATGVAELRCTAADHSAHDILDRAAIQHYRDRIEQLGEQVTDLEQRGRESPAAQARAELDWLVGELSAATGIGGRRRGFTGNGERARVAVTRAIHRALTRIHRADPADRRAPPAERPHRRPLLVPSSAGHLVPATTVRVTGSQMCCVRAPGRGVGPIAATSRPRRGRRRLGQGMRCSIEASPQRSVQKPQHQCDR